MDISHATLDGGVDWLHAAGNLRADMGSENMDFKSFMDSVDIIIMGRKCIEMISSMNLSPEEWSYGDIHIVVLSNSIKEPHENLSGKVEMYSGEIPNLVKQLEGNGFNHAYIDGGATITPFLNLTRV